MIPRKLMYEADKNKLIRHFERLNDDDRYLRFSYPATDDTMKKYIKGSLENFGTNDMWFLVADGDHVVGSVHVALMGDKAEMGFTVEKKYRGKGLGQDLFQRGATWAMMKGAKVLFTQCLSENKVMQHIAQKNGMTVVTISQGEKEATLKATKGTLRAYYDDQFFDNLAFVDMSIHKQWKYFDTLLNLGADSSVG